jgi:hypothetical protein
MVVASAFANGMAVKGIPDQQRLGFRFTATGARVPLALLTCVVCAYAALALAQPMATGAPELPRPAEAEVTPKIRAVFEAIVHDDPALAREAFFPRPAFLRVKDIPDPGGYFDQLQRRFESDIHALHQLTPDLDRAHFERFEFSRRGGFVRPHEEVNRLPYWAARHSWLVYRVDAQLRRIEVRVLISWEDHWYVIHLSEFH